jgi:hypothetical protein
VLLLELAKQGLVSADVLERGDRGPAVVALKRDLKAWVQANSPGEWAGCGVADGDPFGGALEKESRRQGREGDARSARGGRGRVELPLHIRWSGPALSYDLDDRADRARVHEQVLREGTEDDVRFYVDADQLLELWDELVLPPFRSAGVDWLDRT